MKKIFIFIVCLLLIGCSKSTFELEEKYYNNSSLNDIDITLFDTLIENKESFVVFIYQPMCSTSNNFNNIINEFIEKYQISFYKLSFSDLKQTELKKCVKYYPSLVIFKNGKMVDYLDASDEADSNYYKNVDDLKKWFTKYVIIK